MSLGAFSEGLASGARIGLEFKRAKRVNAIYDERLKEIEQKRADEDLLNQADSQAFGSQAAAPISEGGSGEAGPAPGQQTQAPDYLGQYQTAMGNYMKMAADPKYRPVSHEILGRIDELNKSADHVNEFMHRQATEKAWPLIKALNDPTASDEQKSQAATALASDVYPDGKQYRAVVKGGMMTMVDENGLPVMDNGKPRTMKVEDALGAAVSALDTPESWMKARRQSASEARADARAQMRIDASHTENEANRTQARDLADKRNALENSRLGLEDKRITATSDLAGKRALQSFIASEMNSYDKDQRARLASDPTYKPDPAERERYFNKVTQQASGIWGGGMPTGPADVGLVAPEPGQSIDVQMPGATQPAASSGATLPSVPRPASAATRGSAAPQIAVPGDLSIEPTGLEKMGSAVLQGTRDAGSALQAQVPTRIDQITQTAKGLRSDMGAGGRLTRDNVGQISELAKQSDADLMAAGLSKDEIGAIRQMAQKLLGNQ